MPSPACDILSTQPNTLTTSHVLPEAGAQQPHYLGITHTSLLRTKEDKAPGASGGRAVGFSPGSPPGLYVGRAPAFCDNTAHCPRSLAPGRGARCGSAPGRGVHAKRPRSQTRHSRTCISVRCTPLGHICTRVLPQALHHDHGTRTRGHACTAMLKYLHSSPPGT